MMSDIQLILFGHFYNEAYLLPEWIRHHRPLFDKVILFDYHSTDDSVDIIKRMAPEWEVRTTVNKDFDSQLINEEVMRAEAEYTGDQYWKICLNTTEFFFCINPKLVIEKYRQQTHKISCHGVALYDAPEMEYKPMKAPLLRQRHFGHARDQYRFRLLHNIFDGHYHRGRHGYDQPSPDMVITDEIIIAWLGFAPLTEEFLQRKLQIKARVPIADKEQGFGVQHLRDKEQMIADFKSMQQDSKDLLEFAPYKHIYESLYGKGSHDEKGIVTWWKRLYWKLFEPASA